MGKWGKELQSRWCREGTVTAKDRAFLEQCSHPASCGWVLGCQSSVEQNEDQSLGPAQRQRCFTAGHTQLYLTLVICSFLKKKIIYLFMRDTERKRQRHRQKEKQGARCGTRSRVSRITPQAAGGAKLLRHQGCPAITVFF